MAPDTYTSVQIFNQTYRLGSDQANSQSIKQAAAYLDKKIREAASVTGHRPLLDLAVLAAMEIAEEVLRERRKKDTLLSEADRRISNFTRRLEDQGSEPAAETGPPTAPTSRF
ncbi:MAG: cell division protein ZapA [Candidatus Latescibacteria bacterium]|nr:cell division protein ZapA [Candidatus Latescibacterota bacterium]